jgi:hypothetical protein
LKKKNPKSEIRNSKSEMGGPMLFAQKLLASGPQPKHPGIIKFYALPVGSGIQQNEII